MSELHYHPSLTDSQNDAINRAWEILKEHFDSVIIVYDTEAKTGTNRCQSWNYHGGLMTAIGLAEYFRNKVIDECKSVGP